jgi:hypothetical protein
MTTAGYLSQWYGIIWAEGRWCGVKIRVETKYIAESDYGDKTIPIGKHVKLVFRDGQYLTGDIEAVSEESVIISRSDGEYICRADKIRDITAY